MIGGASSATEVGGVGPLFGLGGGSAQASAPERFADFSAIDAQPAGSVGLGRATASADPSHAARAVASFILQD